MPGAREIITGENLDDVPEASIIRDSSKVPRAIAVPMRLRVGYLCGDSSQSMSFESLANAASQVLTNQHQLLQHPLAPILCDLFRLPKSGVRYVFGDVTTPPKHFMANGWSAGINTFAKGVVIDVPISEDFPSAGHWLYFLHVISWKKFSGCPLRGERKSWYKNITVPYECVSDSNVRKMLPVEMRKSIDQISGKFYFSTLGEREIPLDVNLASVFAIQILLSQAGR